MKESREFTVKRYTLNKDYLLNVQSFIPNTPHPWLEAVNICVGENKPPQVVIRLHSREFNDRGLEIDKEMEKRVAHKIRQLSGIKDLLERRWLEAEEMKREEETEECNAAVGFNASPDSKIRSVLNMAGIPRSIEKAVLEELSRIWQKSPA